MRNLRERQTDGQTDRHSQKVLQTVNIPGRLDALLLSWLRGHATWVQVQILVCQSPSIGLMLFCGHLEILNNFFFKEKHPVFTLHGTMSVL